MKLTSSLLFVSVALAQTAATAQTPAPAKPHPATHATESTQACVKLPTISAKVPALPAGLSCAKPLYSITLPTAKLSDVSPMEDPNLRDALGIPLPTPFTLAYIDTKVGSGALLAPKQWYTIKYNGYLVDGTEFDSTDKHPEQGGKFVFQQGPQGAQGQRQVVTGMDTGLDGMRVGGKRRLFIPWQLAYGPNAYNSIPPKSELIFDIELISQDTMDPRTKPVSSIPAPAAAPNLTAAPTPAAVPVVTSPPATAPAPSATPAASATPQPAATKP
jgi:peptidylprolyl isomerase